MLIRTKLHIPQAAPHVVVRPRLDQRLHEWRAARILLVVAPAGFGKTTLVADWARREFDVRRGAPASQTNPAAHLGWVSLDEHDIDPLQFARYLAAALAPVIPGAAAAVEQLLAGARPAPDQLVGVFVNGLIEAPQQVLLILDDYHAIAAPAIHQLMELLLDRAPGNFHCLILARQAPPLAISRFRVRNQLRELRARDLKFTIAETQQFFAAALPSPLPEQELAQLAAQTDGWGAGLQLAALARREAAEDGTLPANLPEERDLLADYMVAELFERQPERLRRFMLQTAILDELTPPLCRAVTGETDSADLLDLLADAVGLMTPLDRRQSIYRYHDLLRAVLRRQLERRCSAEEVQALHRAAAAWYAGAIDQALLHFARAGDEAAAVQLVEQHCLPALLRGELPRAERWLAQLAPCSLLMRPRLALDAAWLSVIDERTDVSVRLTQALRAVACALPPDAAGQPWQQELLGLEAGDAFLRLDMAAAAELSQQGLATIGRDQPMALGICAFVQANLHRYSGPADVVLRQAATADTAFGQAGFIVGQISVQRLRAVCLYESGQAAQAANSFHSLLAFISVHGASQISTAADVHIPYGMLLYQLNRLEEARTQFASALAIGRLLDNPLWTLWASVWLKLCDQAQQRPSPSGQNSDEEDDLLWRKVAAGRSLVLQSEILSLRVQRWLGAQEWTRAWHAAEASPITLDEPSALWQMRIFAAYVHAYLASGRSAAALRPIFARWEAYLDTHGWSMPLKIQLRVAGARLSAALGNHAAAVRALDEALTMVEETGYVRFVLDHLPAVQSILKRSHHPLAQQLLEEAATAAAFSSAPALTAVELRVLKLASQNLTRQQIATDLIVSESTVKFHLARIYNKLGATSRAAALANARQVGLLQRMP